MRLSSASPTRRKTERLVPSRSKSRRPVVRSRSRATSEAVAGSPGAGEGRARRVESLLSGELLDSSRIPYDFDLKSLGLVAVGPDAEEAVGDGVRSFGESSLIVRP